MTLPKADKQLLSHPVLELANLQHLPIMNHRRTQYGIFRATDFQNLYIQLEEKMTTGSDFNVFASRFCLIFAQFDTNNQPISQLQQCTFLARAIAPGSGRLFPICSRPKRGSRHAYFNSCPQLLRHNTWQKSLLQQLVRRSRNVGIWNRNLESKPGIKTWC